MKHIKKDLRKLKKNIFVKDIMSTKVLNLHRDESVYEAIKVMSNKSVSTIVTSKDNLPIGILTERDLVKKMLLKNRDPEKTKIKDIMTKNPITIHPDDSMLKASNVMRDSKVRKLIVIDSKGELVGIVSQTDIIQSLYRLDELYKSILWNPWFSLLLIIVVVILFFLNYVLFRQ